MAKCKVLFFELTPVYAIFDDDGNCINDGTATPIKIYPGRPISMEKTIEQLEEVLSKNASARDK